MADMLKFRKGTYAQINSAAKVPGTIYIAKDEKAMYVDISANERIRIGDFIRVETVEGITPPYSTSALYYVEADNALLKYDGSTWKQVNGTDELAESLEALDSRVTAAEGKITTAEGKITALETKVGAAADGENAATGLFAAVDANAADIAELQAAIGGVGDESLGNRMTAVEGRMDTAEGEIDTLQEAVAGHGATLGQHTTAIAKNAEDIAANAKAIADQATSDAATYATKTELANEKAALQSEIDADVKVEADRAVAAEAALGLRIDGVKTTAESKIDLAGVQALGYVTKVDAEKYTDDAIAGEVSRADGKYATKSELEAVDAKVLKNAGDIETINTNITNNIATKTELTNGVNEAKGYAETKATEAKEAAIADAATKYATTGDLSATNEAVAAAAASAKKANDDLAAYKTEAGNTFATQTALGEEVTARQQAIAKEVEDRNAAIKVEADRAKGVEETLTQAVNKAQGDATKALADAATADGKAVAAQGDIDAWKNAHAGDYDNDTIDAKVKTAKDAADAAQDTADANAESIITLNAAVEKLNGNAEVVGSVDNKVAAAKAELSAEIEKEINAANSMTYINGVGAESELPATAEAGDTYVANGAFTASFGNVLPGDLIIATGKETDGIIGTDDLSWTLVHTGYDATLEQTIKTVDGKIQLTSAVGNVNNGAVSFVAETGSAAKVTVADNTVTVGIVWDDDFN